MGLFGRGWLVATAGASVAALTFGAYSWLARPDGPREIRVIGDALPNHIVVSCTVGGVLRIGGAPSVDGTASCADVGSLVVVGKAGADEIDLTGVDASWFRSLRTVRIDGGRDDDRIVGSPLADTILGRDGNDVIAVGTTEEDAVSGGRGVDRVDVLLSDASFYLPSYRSVEAAGIDTTSEAVAVDVGRTGRSVNVYAGESGLVNEPRPAGTSSARGVVGSAGNPGELDIIVETHDGNVRVDARAFVGSLKVATGSGNDTILGGVGPNQVNAGGGNDRVVGGPEKDGLHGADGDDVLNAEGGGDLFYDSAGADHLLGGAGHDRFFMVVDRGNRLDGGPGRDLVHVLETGDIRLTSGNLVTPSGQAAIVRVESADLLLSPDSGRVRIDARGFGGRAWIRGQLGDDVLFGGDGPDHIEASWGDDFIVGGIGDDEIDASDGFDTCDGGPGGNVLRGCER